jgi:hypothetical protein
MEFEGRQTKQCWIKYIRTYKWGDEGVWSAKGEIKGGISKGARGDEGVWSSKGNEGVLSAKGEMKGYDQQRERWRGVISKERDKWVGASKGDEDFDLQKGDERVWLAKVSWRGVISNGANQRVWSTRDMISTGDEGCNHEDG